MAENKYSEKLRDPRWQRKKSEIQIRDQFACQKCGDKRSTLNVHHRHYLAGREPWDYPGELLILLCEKCHRQEEESKDVLTELIPALHYWGYFNTEIQKIVNNLIESKMPEKHAEPR
jgi:hypothetical protein